MRDFFEKLFSFLTSGKTGTGTSGHKQKLGRGASPPMTRKRRRKATGVLIAWIPTSDILDIHEDSKGVTVSLRLKSGSRFRLLPQVNQLRVQSRKKGLSLVEHSVSFSGSDAAVKELLEYAGQKKNISFLHRNVDGRKFLLGEKTGLRLVDQETDGLLFTGEEADVFYKVSDSCFNELLPNID